MNISDVASNTAAQSGGAVALALQKLTMDSMKSQGSQLTAMLAPQGSVNAPGQGTRLDAWA
jgi:hypothetical protein